MSESARLGNTDPSDTRNGFICDYCGLLSGHLAGCGSARARIDRQVNDAVNRPEHYTWLPNGIEAIEVTEHFNFCRGNALKYIIRSQHKGSELNDLKKARWYLEREIERLEGQL